MPRHVRNTAFCLMAAVPLIFIMLVSAGFNEQDLRVVDSIFLRVLAVIGIFLLWRGVLALEALSRRSPGATESPERPSGTPPAAQ